MHTNLTYNNFTHTNLTHTNLTDNKLNTHMARLAHTHTHSHRHTHTQAPLQSRVLPSSDRVSGTVCPGRVFLGRGSFVAVLPLTCGHDDFLISNSYTVSDFGFLQWGQQFGFYNNWHFLDVAFISKYSTEQIDSSGESRPALTWRSP